MRGSRPTSSRLSVIRPAVQDSRPHTVHCGPEGIYISTLGGGGKDGTDGPPGVFITDCETFDILGRGEIDRGPQNLHYDFWWNLPRDYMVTSLSFWLKAPFGPSSIRRRAYRYCAKALLKET